jgi:hypothetical protein
VDGAFTAIDFWNMDEVISDFAELAEHMTVALDVNRLIERSTEDTWYAKLDNGWFVEFI